jgi:enoyl-CoA hydratase
MNYENILTERHENGIAIVRLNRPKALNALNAATMRELVDALHVLDSEESVRCIVVTGDDRAFAAGADIREMSSASAVEMFTRDTISLWDRVRAVKKPIIAAVSGWCLGGGFELALLCDMIIASETAKFGLPEVTIGVIPGAGGTQRLTRAVGKAVAMEMILNNRQLSAEEALRLGVVNRVSADYLAEASKLAGEIAGRAPIAVRFAKEAINKTYDATLTEGVEFERQLFYFLFSTDDQKEGMSAFLEKRTPEWKGK